jgi:hypothetical protein
MAPTADAFESTAAFETSEYEHGQAGATDADDDPDDGAAPAAGAGWRSRLPGQPRQWALAGMVCGGVLLGGLASGGIAWKMISSRDAEVAARNARLDVQSSRLAEQQQKIDVLTRAISERPLPEDAAPASVSASPAPPVAPAPPAPPAAPAPVALVPAVAPVAARVEPAQRQELQPTGPAGIAPGVAGSGICDVPSGSDSAAAVQ